MICLHNNVVAVISTPIIEVESPLIGNYVSSKRKIKYVCSSCGKISTEKFGSQSDYHYSKIPKSQRYLGKTITIDKYDYWFLNGVEDSDLVIKELHNPTATTYTNKLVQRMASYNDGFTFSTGNTYSTRSLIDTSNMKLDKLTNEDLNAHLKKVRSEVDKRQSDAKLLLDKLCKKKSLSQNKKNDILKKIVNHSGDILNKKYNNMSDVINRLGEVSQSIGKTTNPIGSLFEETINRGYTTAPPKENIAKIPTVQDGINYVILMFFKCRYEKYENENIKYIDFIFNEPLDQNSEKRVILEMGSVVEWVNVSNNRMGISSALFGTTRMIKTIRIKEEDLLATYEKRMGYKVS